MRSLPVALASLLAFALGAAPAQGATPVSPPIAHPGAKGTVILLHQGAWAGPNRPQQQEIDERTEPALATQGYRVVSLDYSAGRAGLASVERGVARERARRQTGPLCLYGESSGAELALITAAEGRRIDCVVGVGTPTSFRLWSGAAKVDPSPIPRYVLGVSLARLGPLDTLGRFDPLLRAKQIGADVLLVTQAKDLVLDGHQTRAFARADPATQVMTTPSGDPRDPRDAFPARHDLAPGPRPPAEPGDPLRPCRACLVARPAAPRGGVPALPRGTDPLPAGVPHRAPPQLRLSRDSCARTARDVAASGACDHRLRERPRPSLGRTVLRGALREPRRQPAARSPERREAHVTRHLRRPEPTHRDRALSAG